jgi:hypothetical protein
MPQQPAAHPESSWSKLPRHTPIGGRTIGPVQPGELVEEDPEVVEGKKLVEEAKQGLGAAAAARVAAVAAAAKPFTDAADFAKSQMGPADLHAARLQATPLEVIQSWGEH